MSELEAELLELAALVGGLVDELEAELARLAETLAYLAVGPHPVVVATKAELDRLGLDASTSAIAADALALAQRIDDPSSTGAEVASCSGRLLRAMDWLRGLAAAKPGADDGDDGDTVDEVTRKREERRAHVRGSAT